MEVTEHSQVVRFGDPNDLDADGKPKIVIDLMLPWSPFQETILAQHVIVDKKTKDRLPTIEAAVVAKYAALVSPYRKVSKKQYDAGDLRGLIKTNHANIDIPLLQSLAGEIWDGGADDILEVVEQALADLPFDV